MPTPIAPRIILSQNTRENLHTLIRVSDMRNCRRTVKLKMWPAKRWMRMPPEGNDALPRHPLGSF